MALVDLIANSGAKNYETMRKGWLPTPEEKAKRRMADLQVERQQQLIDAEPQRRRLADLTLQEKEADLKYLPTKRKLKETKQKMDIQYQQSLIKKHKFDMDNIRDENDLKTYNRNQETVGRILETANKIKDPVKRQQFLVGNKEKLFAAGDDSEDQAFETIMNQKNKDFTKSFNMAMEGNKYLRDLSEERFGKYTSMENFKTGELESVSLNDPDYKNKVNDFVAQGFDVIKTPGLEQTGTAPANLTKSQIGKTVVENADAYKVAQKNILGLNELQKFIQSDDFGGGTAGDAISLVNSVAAQARQIFGFDSVLTNGKLDETKIDPNSKDISRYRRMAINGDRFSAALIELAYVKAKTLDKGGRVTDADLRYAKQILTSGADKRSMIALIRDNMQRTERYYNADTDFDNENFRKGQQQFPRMSYKGILSKYDDSYQDTQATQATPNNEVKAMDAELQRLQQELDKLNAQGVQP